MGIALGAKPYASRRSHVFIDLVLYLLKNWTDDRAPMTATQILSPPMGA